MSKTLQERAKEASSWLHRGEREADGIGKILLPKDGRPDWMDDLCRAAHDSARILPDDWRYEFIGDALDCIEDADTDDEDELRDHFREWFDGAYVSTHEQTAWLASSNSRFGYCDEAVEEFGGVEGGIMAMIALGMLREAEEVFESVLASLQSLVEEDADAQP